MSDRFVARQPSLASMCFGVLLVAAWLNPTHYLPWPAFYSELPAVAGVLVLGCATAWVRRRSTIYIPLSAFVVLAVAAVPLVQWAMGLLLYRADLLLCLVYLSGVAACLTLGAVAASKPEGGSLTDALAWTLLAGALGSTAIALQQWFGLAGWSEWIVEGRPGTRVDANFGQANHMATLVLGGMLASVHLRALGKLATPTLGLILAFLALGLALSQSRTPWLAVGVLAVWAAARQQSLWKPLALRALPLTLLMLWYAALFWAVLTLPGPLLLDSATGTGGRLEVGARPMLWAQMVEAIRMSPWFGYGWLQGHSAQAAAAIAVPGLEYSSYAHNLVLDLILWNGLPLGLLLSALLAGWYLRLGLRATGTADFFCFGVLTVFAVHSMLEYPFAYAYFLVPVALLAGQLERRGASSNPWPGAVAARAVFVLCSAGCVVAVVAIARDYVLAEADRREVQMVIARIGGVRPFPPVPDFWVLDQLEAATRGARIDLRPGMPPAQMDELLKVARRYPSAFFLRASAVALALNGRESEAVIELRRLRGLHGERQYQAGLQWMNETASAKAWPLTGFMARLGEIK